MTPVPPSEASEQHALAQRVRAHLQCLVASGGLITYKTLAGAMALTPPNTIHRVTQALEWLMREDAAHDRPFLAALVISRSGRGLPAQGFFDLACELGRFDGNPMGGEAAVFHSAEVAAARSYWSTAAVREQADAAC